jgi:hypothetical protein
MKNKLQARGGILSTPLTRKIHKYSKIRQNGYYWIKVEKQSDWEIAYWNNKMSGCHFTVFHQVEPLNNDEVFNIDESIITRR